MLKPHWCVFQMHTSAHLSWHLLQQNRCNLWDPIKTIQHRGVRISSIWITVLQLSKGRQGGRVGEDVEVGRKLQRALAVSTVQLWTQSKRRGGGGLKMHGCIHPSTGSPGSQAPEEAFSEELGEWGGGCGGLRNKNYWSTLHPDHGGREESLHFIF